MSACKIAWQFIRDLLLLFSLVLKFYCIDDIGDIHCKFPINFLIAPTERHADIRNYILSYN